MNGPSGSHDGGLGWPGEPPAGDRSGLSGVRPGRVVTGSLSAEGLRLAVVASRFNALVTERLLAGAVEELLRLGADPDAVTVVWVPGAFELPLVAGALCRSGGFDGVVCVGAVIRGETDHYGHVAGQCAAGLAQVQLETGLPVGFGVLTTDTLAQAMDRAGAKAGNKGAEAAAAVVETADLLRSLAREGLVAGGA